MYERHTNHAELAFYTDSGFRLYREVIWQCLARALPYKLSRCSR